MGEKSYSVPLSKLWLPKPGKKGAKTEWATRPINAPVVLSITPNGSLRVQIPGPKQPLLDVTIPPLRGDAARIAAQRMTVDEKRILFVFPPQKNAKNGPAVHKFQIAPSNPTDITSIVKYVDKHFTRKSDKAASSGSPTAQECLAELQSETQPPGPRPCQYPASSSKSTSTECTDSGSQPPSIDSESQRRPTKSTRYESQPEPYAAPTRQTHREEESMAVMQDIKSALLKGFPGRPSSPQREANLSSQTPHSRSSRRLESQPLIEEDSQTSSQDPVSQFSHQRDDGDDQRGPFDEESIPAIPLFDLNSSSPPAAPPGSPLRTSPSANLLTAKRQQNQPQTHPDKARTPSPASQPEESLIRFSPSPSPAPFVLGPTTSTLRELGSLTFDFDPLATYFSAPESHSPGHQPIVDSDESQEDEPMEDAQEINELFPPIPTSDGWYVKEEEEEVDELDMEISSNDTYDENGGSEQGDNADYEGYYHQRMDSDETGYLSSSYSRSKSSADDSSNYDGYFSQERRSSSTTYTDYQDEEPFAKNEEWEDQLRKMMGRVGEEMGYDYLYDTVTSILQTQAPPQDLDTSQESQSSEDRPHLGPSHIPYEPKYRYQPDMCHPLPLHHYDPHDQQQDQYRYDNHAGSPGDSHMQYEDEHYDPHQPYIQLQDDHYDSYSPHYAY